MPRTGRPITKPVSEAGLGTAGQRATQDADDRQPLAYERNRRYQLARIEEHFRGLESAISQRARDLFAVFAQDEDSLRQLLCLLYDVVLMDSYPTRIDDFLRWCTGWSRHADDTTMETRENFPERVEAFAQDAERFILANFNFYDSPVVPYFDLPNILRNFAAEAGKQVKGKKNDVKASLSLWDSGISMSLIRLVDLAKKRTGRRKGEALADMLTGTAHVLGEDKIYTDDWIKKRLERYKPDDWLRRLPKK